MQQPGGGEAPVGAVVPNTSQMSREAKHMRVMLMLCVKEKVFDQNTMENVFAQYLQCEQQNENAEETEAAFRRTVGRTYGPRSKDFLNAIDRAKVKLEQLKERKSKGELGAPIAPLPSSHTIGGPPSSFSGHPVGIPPSQPQQMTQMQQNPQQQFYKSQPAPSHAGMGQPLPHIQSGPPMIGMQPGQNYKPGAQSVGGLPVQYSHQQQLPQHLQQHHSVQHAQQYPHQHQQQMQHHPQHQPQMPQHLPPQQNQQHPHLIHQQAPSVLNQPQPPGSLNQQQFLYDNRPPNLMNPSMSQTSHMNATNFPSHVNIEPPRPPSHPSYFEDDAKTEESRKKSSKKKSMSDDFQDENKKKKASDVKKAKTDKDGMRPGGTPLMIPLSQPEIRHPITIPSNPMDDLDNITEKPNLGSEGLQTTDKGIMTGYVIDGNLLSKEEIQARQMMRDNIYGGSSTLPEPATALTVELEPWMEGNVVGKDILEKIMRTVLERKMEFSSEARKVLSDGIQSHLKTVVEGALELSRKRLNRSAFANHHELFQQLKANDGNATEHHLTHVAMKWGPNVAQVLSEEEKKLAQFYKDYSEIDEEKLKEKMRNFDEERNKIAGAKRKIGMLSILNAVEVEPQANWWEKDQSFESEGVLSYEKIAEVWKKEEIAAKHELGFYVKRKGQKKAESSTTLPPESLGGGSHAFQGKDSSIPMETETANEDEWKDQKCPIEIPSRAVVTSEDIHYLISKINAQRGSVIGSRSTRDNVRKSKFQWKLFSR